MLCIFSCFDITQPIAIKKTASLIDNGETCQGHQKLKRPKIIIKKNADFVEYIYKNVLARLPLVYIHDFQRGIVLGIFAEFIQIDIGYCCLVEVQKNQHDVDYGMLARLGIRCLLGQLIKWRTRRNDHKLLQGSMCTLISDKLF